MTSRTAKRSESLHTGMAMHAARRRSRIRSFTLLEVMLTLAIIVAIASIAATNLKGGFRVQRLKKAADQVRASWSQARVDAIKSGRVQVFYHAVQGKQFFWMPQASYDDPMQAAWQENGANSDRSFGTAAAGNNSSLTAGSDARSDDQYLSQGGLNATPDREALPRDITFLGADVRIDQRSSIQLSQSQGVDAMGSVSYSEETGETEEVQWGTPIFFFPDGTSSSAQLVLENGREQSVSIYLRGLTGIARVGPVQSGMSAVQPQIGAGL